ncbi:MAG: hypothetical protein ACXVED_19075, partial [Bacteroidia bacterium]
QHMRFGMVLIQMLPLAALKLGLSLDNMIKVYSIGFILYYFTCFVFCTLVFKSYRTGLILLLFNILFASHSFYWMISELPQGIALMLVYFAYVDSRKDKKPDLLFILISTVFLIPIAFFHPLIPFAFLFTIIFLGLQKTDGPPRNVLMLATTLFVIILLAKHIFFKIPHDSESSQALKNIIDVFPNYLKPYSNSRFLFNCLTKYYWIPILLVLISRQYMIDKQTRKLALFLLFSLGYLFMVNISYPDNYTTDFYIENLYLPLGIFIALPFIYDVLPTLEKKKLAWSVVALICITGCIRIYSTHTIYTVRLDWERKFMKQHPDQKVIINSKYTPKDTLLLTWGAPFEFWLLSTTEQNKTASVIIADDISMEIWKSGRSNEFATTWEMFPYKLLDKRYFKFTDSTSAYTIIN